MGRVCLGGFSSRSAQRDYLLSYFPRLSSEGGNPVTLQLYVICPFAERLLDPGLGRDDGWGVFAWAVSAAEAAGEGSAKGYGVAGFQPGRGGYARVDL